jgi:hypothetical protein
MMFGKDHHKGFAVFFCSPLYRAAIASLYMGYRAKCCTSGLNAGEMIIQRGTTFKVIKVEKKGSDIYFDLEVVSQIAGE